MADPVLERILGRAFEGVCAEMGSAMIQTATSAVFVEGRDFSCALLDPRAELVATANYDPSHLSAMALTAEYALMELGHDDLAEGDVIVVNDPYRGGGHLPDIAVIRPIFIDGALMGLAMNRGHHIDVGGMAVAGFPGNARSMFQEGIRIPPVKWFEGGVEKRSRPRPDPAQRAVPARPAGRLPRAARELHHRRPAAAGIVARHGRETVSAAMTATKDRSERLMRAAIAEVPDGDYRFENLADDDGTGDTPYRVAVEIRLARRRGDDRLRRHQRPGARADQLQLRQHRRLVLQRLPAHARRAHPVQPRLLPADRFHVPRGSFLNPVAPAPTFGGVTEISITIIDAVMGALAQAVPEKVAAGSYGTCINVAGGGDHPRRASRSASTSSRRAAGARPRTATAGRRCRTRPRTSTTTRRRCSRPTCRCGWSRSR